MKKEPNDTDPFKWKSKRSHKNLGEVFVTVDCLAMQIRNTDPDTIFVEHNGEIKEVSRSMIELPEPPKED